MKRLIILVLTAALLFGGCSWMDGEYHSVKPHYADSTQQMDKVVTVSGYNELRDALVELVTTGRLKSTFYTVGIEEEYIDQYMNTAIMHVFQNSAVGAYAVDEIKFEYGTSGGKPAIAVDVTYLHNRAEILRIKKAENMDGVKNTVAAALGKCDAYTVIKVNQYEELDLELYVEEYAKLNPHICMETPQVAVAVYPNQGNERVLEITFTYQTSRDALRIMQDTVEPVFSAAELYVQGSEDTLQKYEQLYAFLMERFDYTLETSTTPAYSLLRYGVGDSKAFAVVYSYMCRSVGLDCSVVSGTRNGEAWNWNMIRYEDEYYHVDLLTSSQGAGFAYIPYDQMHGYVWDYSMYH